MELATSIMADPDNHRQAEVDMVIEHILATHVKVDIIEVDSLTIHKKEAIIVDILGAALK